MSLLNLIPLAILSELIALSGGLTPRSGTEFNEKLSKYVVNFFMRSKRNRKKWPSNNELQQLCKLAKSPTMMQDPIPEWASVERTDESLQAARTLDTPSAKPDFYMMCKWLSKLEVVPSKLFLLRDKSPNAEVANCIANALSLTRSDADFLPRAPSFLGYVSGKGKNAVWKFRDEANAKRYSPAELCKGAFVIARLDWRFKPTGGRSMGCFEAMIPSSVIDGCYDFGHYEAFEKLPLKRDPEMMAIFMRSVHPLTPIKDVTQNPQPCFLNVVQLRSPPAEMIFDFNQPFFPYNIAPLPSMRERVIVLAGEKGTGKSVLTRELEAANHVCIDSDDWGRSLSVFLDRKAERMADIKDGIVTEQQLWDEIVADGEMDTSEFKKEAERIVASPIKRSDAAAYELLSKHYLRCLNDKVCGFRNYIATRMNAIFATDEWTKDEGQKLFIFTHTAEESSSVLFAGYDGMLLANVNGEIAIRSRQAQDVVGTDDVQAELHLHAFYKKRLSSPRKISIMKVLHKVGIVSDSWDIPMMFFFEPSEGSIADLLTKKIPIRGIPVQYGQKLMKLWDALSIAFTNADSLVTEEYATSVKLRLHKAKEYLATAKGASSYLQYLGGNYERFAHETRELGLTIHVDEAIGLKYTDITPAHFGAYAMMSLASAYGPALSAMNAQDVRNAMASNRSTLIPESPGRMHLTVGKQVFGWD